MGKKYGWVQIHLTPFPAAEEGSRILELKDTIQGRLGFSTFHSDMVPGELLTITAAVIRWGSIPVLSVTGMDLLCHEENPRSGLVAASYHPWVLLAQNSPKALELSEDGICGRQERENWQQTLTATALCESNSWRNYVITGPDSFPRGNFHPLP